ncbi:HNH endonuclease [Ralstonia solanacearum]|uniref:HNH endonuclease n=1 Tax=Ralstonia solanacearum TaxID=305 RepID=UPI003D8085FF
MKLLIIDCGRHVALVDDDMYEELASYKWRVSHNGYAFRHPRVDGTKQQMIYMHKVIMGDRPGYDIDHADGNKLNNVRDNLRFASRSQNNMNARPREGCSSQFKGVAWLRGCKRWWAYINKDGKRTSLGYFIDETDAARAYNAAAKNLFGEFARLNTI